MRNKFLKNFSPEGLRLRAVFLLLAGSIWLSTLMAQTITGTVIESNGEPIIGANVMIRNTKTGTITNMDGQYTIKVNGPNDVLEFSMLGFVKTEQQVGNRTVINITMKEDSKMLEEVVVVGYGTMKKKDLTGAVSMINAETFEKEQPVTVQDLLRSNVPGLAMGIAKDTKGNVTDMTIRGKSNFRTDDAANAPLLVLDGVIYYGELTDINPNDIERIDVLKDGSSAAVYGSKAANGVIIVTTKKGKEGAPVIRFGSTLGMAIKKSLPETYTGYDYLTFHRDVMKSIQPHANPKYYDDPRLIRNNQELSDWMEQSTGDMVDIWFARINLTPMEAANYKAGREVDWEELTYRDVAINQDYSISVSGKKETTSYYTSLNYVKNENNLRGGGYSAIRARINLESKIMDRITYGVNAQFTSRDEGYTAVGSTGYRLVSPFGDVYNEDETLRPYPNGNSNARNPLLDAHYTDKRTDVNSLNASLFMKIDLPLGFSIQSTYSPRFQWTEEFIHKSEDHPLWQPGADGSPSTDAGVSREHRKRQYWQWDNMLKWNKTFGKHSFDFTYLMNWERLQNWNTMLVGRGFDPNDELGYHGILWASEYEVPASYDSKTKNNDDIRQSEAMLARLHYTYMDRYMVTGAFRSDGDSAFGKENPYAYFPSVALAWVFSEEKFVAPHKWLNYGKLRLSYGENGNREIGIYEALMRLASRKYNYIGTNGSVLDMNTYFADRMANYGLMWESTRSYNAGLDFAVIDNRLSGNIDVYLKKTNNLLNSRQLPNMIGYATVMSNIGEVQNTGIELALTSRNISSRKLQWTTNYSFSYNKNKINKLYGIIDPETGKEADDIQNARFIGQSMHEIWDYEILGTWQESETEEADRFGRKPGDFKLNKNDWESTTYSDDDKKFLGSKVPIVRMGLRNSLTILNDITLSFNIYAYLGHYQMFNRAKNDNANLRYTNNIKAPYWTPENPTHQYARIGSSNNVAYNVWRKADLLRLENISIGYQFPRKALRATRMQALNLNVSVKNLAYITKWPGGDPENPDANTPTYVYFGTNITF